MGITEAFFSDIEKRRYEPLLHSVSGSIYWDIEDGGEWYVRVENGKMYVSQQKMSADCVCNVRKDDFERMVLGKQNPFTLFLQMKMSYQGNLGFAQLFQRLFPDEAVSKGVYNEQ